MDIFILELHGLKCDASTLATEKKDAKTPQRNVFVPDKRQMRMDMLCDNDLKTVCVFPISTADMMRPELAELYTKCLSISTTFYNGKDEEGKLVEQGSVRLYVLRHCLFFSKCKFHKHNFSLLKINMGQEQH